MAPQRHLHSLSKAQPKSSTRPRLKRRIPLRSQAIHRVYRPQPRYMVVTSPTAMPTPSASAITASTAANETLQSPAASSLATVKSRIEELVHRRAPLDMNHVSQLYEKTFHQRLDFKALGFKKLKGLLATIPTVDIQLANSINTLTLISPASSSLATVTPASNSLATVKSHIEELVHRRAPLDMSVLCQLYEKTFHQGIDYKALGFNQLKALLKTIPTIDIRPTNSTKSSPVLYFLADQNPHPVIADSGVVPTVNTGNGSTEEQADLNRNNRQTIKDLVTTESAVLSSAGNRVDCVRESYGVVQSILDFTQDKTNEVPVPLSSRAPLDAIASYFAPEKDTEDTVSERGLSIGDEMIAKAFKEAALLGQLCLPSSCQDRVFLNTHEPFCLAAVGVQGSGKSHTLACVLESCLLPFETENIVRLKKPMTALVLHYDQNTTSVCEAAGLLSPAPALKGFIDKLGLPACGVSHSKAIVLVSPTFYKQRKAFYGEYCNVRPLLFKWSSLTADHIKRIMRIGADDNQLYVASFMSLLRRYQRQDVVPKFAQFIKEVKEVCNIKGQQGPLDQRIALLESMIAESEINQDIEAESMDLAKACFCGFDLVIADLTDPLLSKEEVNGLFQVVTEQFRSIRVDGGKLLALDEAHKFMDGVKSDGLSEAIVDVARLMRHDGMRLVVSTQSPKALAPELLELVSVAVLHQFHSQDWWTYLKQKLPLPDDGLDQILSLRTGNALVFASRLGFKNHQVMEGATTHFLRLRIRPRITADFGASRTNS